ncbi:Peptidyl-prolyl cis-trans isomerase A (Cyclophilin A) [Sphingomonas sp. EC-HK361]|uniref:peptidylprolyl isomerase n=1 Tax=Sphingomonas sp. EC-HK361 TaxID=2038397 RepID=UPI001253273A|nr:peptidylprolyl isomerase [Sphingomonas sp. EC-HK361]VVS97822.1 Peptidyl-prolyl cis-trans isomerase A (Cyclophilin A) [Sphingomonas sp. EC-HK361]
MRISTALLALFVLASPAGARPATGAGIVRVRFATTLGPIVIAVDQRHAPKTAANFLAYVDDGRFDGISFYRSSRRKAAPKFGFIQGGIRTDARRILPPFAFESTAKTGIKHLDATISMARRADPSSAGGNFFITVGAIPTMDASPGQMGYAAFGRIVSGMGIVRNILAMPTGGGMGGQLLLKPVTITKATRLDGKAKPTGLVKPWLIDEGRGRTPKQPLKPQPARPSAR